MVAVVVALAGCTGDPISEKDLQAERVIEDSQQATDDAAASAAPEQRAADAAQRYKEYRAIQDASFQQGASPHRELVDGGYLASESKKESVKRNGDAVVFLGETQTGDSVVLSMEMAAYQADPLEEDFTDHKISFHACTDVSTVDFGPNYESDVVVESMSVVMRGIPGIVNGKPTIVWAVEHETHTEREC
jgi:hypothetical protein